MKNIVFDLGGVVIDWSPKRVLNEFPGDKKLPESLFQRGFFEQYWSEFDRGMLTEEKLVEEMVAYAGKPYEECYEFVRFIKHSLVDIPRTVELIKTLSTRGYGLYCLSNMSFEFYDYLKVRDVFGYFDGQVISAHEHIIKPEEGIYRLLLERYNLNPRECLFIDDLEPNIKAAAALGINTVHFADREKGYREIEEKLKLNKQM